MSKNNPLKRQKSESQTPVQTTNNTNKHLSKSQVVNPKGQSLSLLASEHSEDLDKHPEKIVKNITKSLLWTLHILVAITVGSFLVQGSFTLNGIPQTATTALGYLLLFITTLSIILNIFGK